MATGKKKKLLILISEGVSDRTQAENQARALHLFNAKNIPYETVNGMDPNQRERRNELFQISGIRANYPQFFFILEDNSETIFYGSWDKVEALNEGVGMDLLEGDTWDSVFGNLAASFP